MDRVGNSLDRTLLLAELLSAAGHKVRLANRSLTDIQANQLLGLVKAVPDDPLERSGTAPRETEEVEYQRLAKATGVEVDLVKQSVRSTVERAQYMGNEAVRRIATQVPFLTRTVGEPKPPDDWSRRAAVSIADHWWVQLQAGSDWIDLDLLAPTARSNESLGAPEQTFPYVTSDGRIPLGSQFVQEVTVRVIIEQSNAGHATEHTPLEYALRPAETQGDVISVQIVPKGWPPDGLNGSEPEKAVRALALKQKEWLPTLTVGDSTISQSSFTDRGDVNSAPGREGGPAGGVLGGAFGALGGDEPAEDGQLTAVWIEYEVRVPAAAPSKIRRALYSRSGAHQTSPGPTLSENDRVARALRLLDTIQIFLQNCRPSPEYVVHESLVDIGANRAALTAWGSGIASRNVAQAIEQSRKLKPTTNRLLGLALARFAWSVSSQDVYLALPNILSYRSGIALNSAGAMVAREGFDIVTNGVSVRHGSKASAFVARLSQGVADTNAEGVLETDMAVNAGTILRAHLARSEPWSLIRSARDPALSGGLPPAIRSQLVHALDAGLVVVVPAATTSTSAPWVWWQVDPVTGDALGMGEFGGQSLTERALLGAAAGLVTYLIVDAICVANKGGSTQIKAEDVAKCTCAGTAGGVGVGTYVATYAIKTGPAGFFFGLGWAFTAGIVAAFCAL